MSPEPLGEYGKNKKYEYPGKSDIEEYRDFLEDIIEDSKSEKELCNNIIKEFDEFEELKTKVDTVFDFFEIGKKLFQNGIL